jgi:hypothetical protein
MSLFGVAQYLNNMSIMLSHICSDASLPCFCSVQQGAKITAASVISNMLGIFGPSFGAAIFSWLPEKRRLVSSRVLTGRENRGAAPKCFPSNV